jgi:hypothetical protein
MAVLLNRKDLLIEIVQHRFVFEFLKQFFQEMDPKFRNRHQRLHPHAAVFEFSDFVFEHVLFIRFASEISSTKGE